MSLPALERIVTETRAEPAGSREWSGHCPGPRHRRGDHNPSLSIGEGADGKILVYCHAGCPTRRVLDALNLQWSDLSSVSRNGKRGTVEAVYPYLDEKSNLLFQVVRLRDPKGFYQLSANGERSVSGIGKVLYGLPEVLAAVRADQSILVVEGEKDADAVNDLDTGSYVATTNPGGAGKWRPEYTQTLAGAAKVGIVADDDGPGREHAAYVASQLANVVGRLRVLLPAEGCKDVSDHLEAGHKLTDLRPVPPEEWRRWLATSNGTRSLVVQRSSDIVQRKVDWIWKRWLPKGKLTVLDGDPATGKSTLSLDIAARVTTGKAMPDGSPGVSGDVVLLSGEDDADDTTTWRLDAAGADRSRVFHLYATKDDEGECPITIPRDLDLLEGEIGSHETALVVIDVLAEYLEASVDNHNDPSVRRVLHLLRNVASRTGAAILCLRHLRKEGSAKAIYRGGGSIGIIGAARAGWILDYHPDDESLRVLAPQKVNNAVPAKPLGFKLKPWPLDPDYAWIDWKGEVDTDANQLSLAQPTKVERETAEEEASALEYAESVVRQLLPNPSVEMWVKDFQDQAAAAGVQPATLKRARSRLNVKPKQYRKPDKDGNSGWKVCRP